MVQSSNFNLPSASLRIISGEVALNVKRQFDWREKIVELDLILMFRHDSGAACGVVDLCLGGCLFGNSAFGNFSTVTFSCQLQDRAVMNKPVDGSNASCIVREDIVPLRKTLV